MSPTKPLGYESSKIVLQYLDANSRFQLSSHCPFLRKTEKRLPLYIDELTFESERLDTRIKMKINSTEYFVGCYRNYPPGVAIPLLHSRENEEGGVPAGLTRFGFRNYYANTIRLPGDAIFGWPITPYNVFLGGMEIEKIKRDIEIQRDIDPNVATNYELQKLMDNLQSIINKKDNVTVLYTTFTRLTIVSNKDGSKQIHHFNGEIHEAEKALYNLLFGNRKNVITVNKLYLKFTGAILRFPVDMKINIRNLKTLCFLRNKNKQLFNNSTLNSIEILNFNQYDTENQLLKRARKLITRHIENPDLLESIENQEFYVRYSNMISTDYLQLLRQWKDNEKAIGTCFSFGNESEGLINEVIRDINIDFYGKRLGDRFVEIPMNETSKLYASWIPDGELEEGKWIFKLEVVAI